MLRHDSKLEGAELVSFPTSALKSWKKAEPIFSL